MSTLFSLAEDIRKCTACPLWKEATLAVPGQGNKDAKIIIIGEAPGEEEDRQGLPFAGRSGKVLDDMLRLAELDRKKVFLTNVVKHRPPQNRAPKVSEINKCKGLWLDKQIELLKPKLIILLGAVAMKSLVRKSLTNDVSMGNSVEEFHGKVIREGLQKYFVTFHPAAALRFPEIRKKMEDDFKKLKKVVQKV